MDDRLLNASPRITGDWSLQSLANVLMVKMAKSGLVCAWCVMYWYTIFFCTTSFVFTLYSIREGTSLTRFSVSVNEQSMYMSFSGE